LGFRRWLLDRGKEVTGRVVTSMVPVSTRQPGSTTQRHDNQVTSMFADLPVGIEDPLDVVAAVSAQLRHLKGSGEAVSASMLIKAGDFVPSSLFALGARVAVQAPQRSVATVTTNVPGPQWPMYLLHSRMLEAFPFIPLGGDMRVTVGIFSYDGQVTMGINGDYDAMPDLQALGEHIEDALADLRSAVG
jgi:diacylglycerol O-acyltransferase